MPSFELFEFFFLSRASQLIGKPVMYSVYFKSNENQFHIGPVALHIQLK